MLKACQLACTAATEVAEHVVDTEQPPSGLQFAVCKLQTLRVNVGFKQRLPLLTVCAVSQASGATSPWFIVGASRATAGALVCVQQQPVQALSTGQPSRS
jgi:hypothetical protein